MGGRCTIAEHGPAAYSGEVTWEISVNIGMPVLGDRDGDRDVGAFDLALLLGTFHARRAIPLAPARLTWTAIVLLLPLIWPSCYRAGHREHVLRTATWGRSRSGEWG